MRTPKLTDKDTEIRRLQCERDLYRARAIDEVMDHHNANRQVATLDVDLEVRRHLQSYIALINQHNGFNHGLMAPQAGLQARSGAGSL